MPRTLVVALLLAVAGCAAPDPTPTAPTTAPTTAASSTTSPIADRIQLRVAACSHLDEGADRAAVEQRLQDDWGISAAEAARVVDDAVAADGLCPWQRPNTRRQPHVAHR
jgi:hypothetical protein